MASTGNVIYPSVALSGYCSSLPSDQSALLGTSLAARATSSSPCLLLPCYRLLVRRDGRAVTLARGWIAGLEGPGFLTGLATLSRGTQDPTAHRQQWPAHLLPRYVVYYLE